MCVWGGVLLQGGGTAEVSVWGGTASGLLYVVAMNPPLSRGGECHVLLQSCGRVLKTRYPGWES